MTRFALPVLLAVVALLGGPSHAASQSGVRVDVLLPYGRIQLGGPVTLYPGSAGGFRPSRVIVVHVPVLFAYRSQACADVQTMTRLARMTGAGMGMEGDLAAGAAFACSGFGTTIERWPNGERATTLGGDWFYPNGERASAVTGSWFYPDGTRARALTATWYYPNGERARRSDGTWFTTEGDRIGKLGTHVGREVTAAILERLWAAGRSE